MQKITSRKKLTLYGCAGVGVNMLNIIMGSYLCSALLVGGFESHIESWTYLGKDLVVAGLWAVFVFIAKALDGIIDLPFATLADKMKTKLGRRKTAILVGFVPMIIAYLLFLVPINPYESIGNTIWFGVLLCIFYSFYTLTMLTYYATFAEVCKDERDMIYLSNVKSILDVVYFSLGFALLPVFISMDINIRIVALIFLPLSLTMLIPMFMLKENKQQGDGEQQEIRTLTLKSALACSFSNKTYIYWLFTASMATIGLQLFLGGINEVFSTTGLNMTFVMASSFAPVPFTLILYNKVVKKYGIATAYRYSLIIFSLGMIIMFLCCIFHASMQELHLTLIAILGGIFVSFSLGAFFSITYTVPTSLANREFQKTGNGVSGMYFAVQGLFEGIAAGIATGFILVTLKDNDVIELLPIIACVACAITFVMTFFFPKDLSTMGKVEPAAQIPTPSEPQIDSQN
ncbi:MAG: MFS transporter [Clostridia bacterium]|nr:MFS transporter [Clostridia bacterium]